MQTLKSSSAQSVRPAPVAQRTRPRSVVVRAQCQPERSPLQLVQSVVLSGLAATMLVLHPQPVLAAETVPQEAYEQEAAVEEQKSMLNFLLQQQENAKKAAILAQRQQLQAEVGRVEAALQARLTQQKANAVGATQSGDSRALETATAAATELEEKQAQIIKAAAQLSSQLDRMELIERARSAAARQTIEKAASTIDGAVNAKLNPWFEALGRAARP